jgi:hypothetical protein
MGKGYSPEQIVRKLRQAEGKLATGSTIPEVARELGISEALPSTAGETAMAG